MKRKKGKLNHIHFVRDMGNGYAPNVIIRNIHLKKIKIDMDSRKVRGIRDKSCIPKNDWLKKKHFT